MLVEPTVPEDLLPPFAVIGEPGWEAALRQLLVEYGVPLPTTASEAELTSLEARLDRPVPSDYRAFMSTFGPLNFDGVALLPSDRAFLLGAAWFRDSLVLRGFSDLDHYLAIADAGSDDYAALDLRSGLVSFASHDPPGFYNPVSFSDFIRLAVIDLALGRYGWGGDEVEDLAAALKQRLFGFPFWF